MSDRQGIPGLESTLQTMLAVSTASVSSARRAGRLDLIAGHACKIASAQSAAILELTGQERFRIVGSHELSDDYRRLVHDWPAQLRPGRGPSGLAVALGAPVVSDDFQTDPRFREWVSLSPGWRAIAVFPLIVEDVILGTLVLYRTRPEPWSDPQLRLLGFVAEQAAVAVRTAQLIDEQQRQVDTLERLVRSLREQAHEHANRLHAIAGFLALGEADEARRFVHALTEAHFSDRDMLDRARPHSALTALLGVEARLARHRSIDLEVALPPRLPRTALTDAQAVTIVGNLLDNALDAVAEMPPARRRVQVAISHDARSMRVAVADWGGGVPDDVDPFLRGSSGKAGHAGVGLALVREAVIAAYGDIAVRRRPDGTTVEVVVPTMGPVGDEDADRTAPPAPRALRGVDAIAAAPRPRPAAAPDGR